VPVTSAMAPASSPVWRARAGTSQALTASHPAGRQGAGEFGGAGGRVGQVRQAEAGDHGGEGAAGNREDPGVSPHQRPQQVRAAGAGEHGRRQVGGDHVHAASRAARAAYPGPAPASKTVLPAVTRAASSSGRATGMVNWLKNRW